MGEREDDVPLNVEIGEKDLAWDKDDLIEMGTSHSGLVKIANHKVYDYDMDSMLRLGFFRIISPVLQDGFVILQAMCVVILSACICVTLVLLDEHGFIEVDATLINMSAAVFGYFGSLMGFLFGYFVFTSVAQAAACKNNGVGGYMAAFCNLMLLTGAWFPEDDQKTKEFKREILRLALSMFALVCGEGAEKPKDEVVSEVVARGLLTDSEAKVVRSVTGGHCNVPLIWIHQAYRLMLDKQSPPDPCLAARMDRVEICTTAARGGIGTILSLASGWGHPPLPLVHMMSGLVKWQFFLLALKEGIALAFMLEHQPPAAQVSQFTMSVLIVFLTPVIFQSLLEVVIQIRNPFGDDWVDYPRLLFHKWLRDELDAYIFVASEASSKIRILKKLG
jgi:hypothetical protein